MQSFLPGLWGYREPTAHYNPSTFGYVAVSLREILILKVEKGKQCSNTSQTTVERVWRVAMHFAWIEGFMNFVSNMKRDCKSQITNHKSPNDVPLIVKYGPPAFRFIKSSLFSSVKCNQRLSRRSKIEVLHAMTQKTINHEYDQLLGRQSISQKSKICTFKSGR